MIRGMKGHTLEAIREALIGFFVHAVTEKGPVMVEQAMKKITDDHRAELFVFIDGMTDDDARQALKRRHRECKNKDNPGAEDRFVNILTRLWLVVKDDPTKHWIFTSLGHKDDEEFNQILYFLENDALKQWFQKARKIGRETLGSVLKGLRAMDDAIGEELNPLVRDLRRYNEESRARKGFAPPPRNLFL